MTRTRFAAPVALLLAGLASAACGGSSSSGTSPTPVPTPTGSACASIGTAAAGLLAIINGTACSTDNSSVVTLNLRDKDDLAVGTCSGTVIAPRAVLTAAHCLADPITAAVKVWRGSGDQVLATSFHASPGYRENDMASLDVGVVLTGEDLGRPAIPLLATRDATVGEQAVIAGWGKNELGVGTTLRAGFASITTVGPYMIETRYTVGGTGSGVCAGDSGGPLLVSQAGSWAVAGVISATGNTGCTTGPNYFTNLRNADAASFVSGLVPEAGRK